MESIWMRTAPPFESDEFPPGPWDVVVVGAGITGIVTAVLLVRSGLSVVVLDKHQVGSKTTGGTMGKLSLLQGTRYSNVEKHTDWSTLWAYAEANREGQAWLIHQMDMWGMPIDWSTSWVYASAPDQTKMLRAELNALQSVNMPVQWQDAADLPYETFGAIRMERQVPLQPLLVLHRLVAEMRGRGGLVVENCRVTGLEPDGPRINVATEQGVINSRFVVLATGKPVLNSRQYPVNLGSFQTHVAAYSLPEEKLPPGMYIAAGPPVHSVRRASGPDGNPVLVASGGHQGAGDSPESALENLDGWVQQYFSTAAQPTRRISSWTAGDYWTSTNVPFTGFVPGTNRRVLAATGYDGWGMSNSVAAGLTISAEILGGQFWWARTMREHVSIFR